MLFRSTTTHTHTHTTNIAATAKLSLTFDPMRNSLKNLLVRNYLLNLNQNMLKWSFSGPLPELYPNNSNIGCNANFDWPTTLVHFCMNDVSGMNLLRVKIVRLFK